MPFNVKSAMINLPQLSSSSMLSLAAASCISLVACGGGDVTSASPELAQGNALGRINFPSSIAKSSAELVRIAPAASTGTAAPSAPALETAPPSANATTNAGISNSPFVAVTLPLAPERAGLPKDVGTASGHGDEALLMTVNQRGGGDQTTHPRQADTRNAAGALLQVRENTTYLTAQATSGNTPSAPDAVAPVAEPKDATPLINPVDIIYNISAADQGTYQYSTLQCYGANRYWWDWGGASGYPIAPGAFATIGADGLPRGDVVADPADEAQRAFYFAVKPDDPDTSGAGNKRCELSLGWKEYSYPGKLVSKDTYLPRNKDFWWSVKFRLGDWGATSDRQVIWQWFASDPTGLGPILAADVWGNKLRMEIHSDYSANPSPSTMEKLIPWTLSNWKPGQWYTMVINARIDSVKPDQGKVFVWLDGVQVLAYSGAVGYTSSAPAVFAKIGMYHWTSGNPWDYSAPKREAWFKGPILLSDREGYTAAQVAALIK